MRSPDVVIVGAATRDLDDGDPRGWRLGGGVTYGALALARLGLRTGVLLGMDASARDAMELDMLREAGADIVEVPLRKGPVFHNVETLAGRIQTCEGPSEPVPAAALPDAWRDAPCRILAPVAAEIGDDWAAAAPPDVVLVFAWQGALRHLEPGVRVRPLTPGPSPLLRRADLVAVSRHDLPEALLLRSIGAWLGSSAEVLLTAGLLGGVLLRFEGGRITRARAYPSVPSELEIDATGAGDTMLAGLVAARLAAGAEACRSGRDLRLGALAASLLVEGPGMGSVPTLAQLHARHGGAARAS
jgi:sugar/nucleoside kinase (ribokinase family)